MSNIPSIFDPYALNGEIDPHFGDPEPRLRSNTWPMPRPENWPKVKQENEDPTGTPPPGLELGNADGQLSAKKNSSRRNAWGNMSYADLITKAIQGSPEQRLTLSQIYDWMVRNVPYFKDKGDSNSSAGWKNSIRHNLSLHNRFMRVQNEGTGKSSWWVINPDAKPGKSTRRRAGSMDTPKYEKKRTRVKKKMEMLRSGLLDNTSSPTSSDGGDLVVDAFQLSVSDFRPRTSSNASSCSRLSPIPAIDADAPDNRVPPGMSPISWEYKSPSGFSSGVADQLTDTLTEAMKLNKSPLHELSPKASDPFSLDFCSPVAFPPSPAKFPDPSSPYSSFGSPYPATTLSSRTDGFQPALSPAPQLTTLQQPRGQELLINHDPMMSSTALNRNKYTTQNHHQALSILTPVTVADSSISPGGLLESLKLEEQSMLPSDLDLPLGELQGLDCDVNQVLQHEISVEGNLDFVDFENFGMVGQVPSTNTQSETTSGLSWVR